MPMPFGTFQIDEWQFEATQPATDDDPREFVVTARRGDEVITRRVPMFYPNLWGVDSADAQALDVAVDELIVELGLE